MTLSLPALRDWQNRERDTPGDLTMPPVPPEEFAEAWKAYLAEQRQKDGDEHGIIIDQDAEVYAAMDVLDNIFEMRRAKIASKTEANPNGNPPTVRHEFRFESEAWFGLTDKYRRLDEAYMELKMGQPAPGKGKMGARK